jgi:acetyl esterase/lipase
MQKGMGQLPELGGVPDFDLEYTDSVQGNNYVRYSINFLAAENERVTAYLYIPGNAEKGRRIPAMLALHETDSLGKGSVDGQGINPNLAYAKELAERGYIVIAPDYPSFGETQEYDFENDRYESGTMKGIFNHMRSIDLLQSMPMVDPEQIGVIGHSLGGHNSIFIGAFDTRLKIVVSSCGWTGFDFYNIGEEYEKKYGGRLGPWAQERYMPLLREKYDLDSNKIPFDFDEMISSIAPRVFFSSSPVNDSNFDVKGVQHIITDILAVYRFLGVPDNLQVFYPEGGHDFPWEMRTKAYALIDSVLQHESTLR